MASPVDAARTPTNVSTAADPWSVALPASSASELLFLYVRVSAELPVTPSGWTRLGSLVSDASDDTSAIYYRWTDGSEGVALSFEISASAKGAAIAYRITGAENPSTQPPVTAAGFSSGTGANPDFSSNAPSPPAGSPTDFLFICVCGMDGETQSFTEPAGYANLQQADSGTGGSAATNVRIAGASKQATATEDDPGAWTVAAPQSGWSGITVAFYPGAASLAANTALVTLVTA